jgi:hypothetical protein
MDTPRLQTPRLDALARSGLRFAEATTVVPLTLPAHASLMTGTFPAWHGVRDNGGFYLGDDQVTLAEVRRASDRRFRGRLVLDRRWGSPRLRPSSTTSTWKPAARPP